MSFTRGLFWPPATISKPCTIGTPAAIIVANWRLKMEMSRGLIELPALPNSGFGFGFTDCGLMPWRRNSALTKAALLVVYSPFIRVPRLSRPTQTNVSVWLSCARDLPTLS